MRRVVVFLAVVFAAALVSSEIALSLPILGVGPDLLVVVLVAASTAQRPTSAAAYGFTAGLFRDLLLTSPKGLSAFAFALTAYSVALVGEVRGVWATIALVSGATFVSQVLYGFAALLLSPNTSVGSLPRVALLTTAYNTVLSPFLMPVLRRLFAPEVPGALREGGSTT